MAKPLPQELRDRVLAAYDRGMQTKQIAEVFLVSPAWARRVKQRRRQTGRTCSLPMGGATVVKIPLQRLRELAEQQPDATVSELHARLGRLGIACSVSAVDRALRRLGLSFKKRRCVRRNRIGPMLPDSDRAGEPINRLAMPRD
jgi:transposase